MLVEKLCSMVHKHAFNVHMLIAAIIWAKACFRYHASNLGYIFMSFPGDGVVDLPFPAVSFLSLTRF